MPQLLRMMDLTARPNGVLTQYGPLEQMPAAPDEEASIRAAMRMTLCFAAIVTILLWASVVQASTGDRSPTLCAEHERLDVPPTSSPTLR